MVLAALGSWSLYRSAGETAAVIVVATGVPEGEVIERSDLVSRDVAGVDDTYSVGEVDELVGRTAAVDLVAGQVVTKAATTTVTVPGEGQAQLGLALAPSRVPDGLEQGDAVRVIVVPSEQSGESAALDEPKVLAASAQVFSVRGVAAEGGSQRVTLLVPGEAADSVAAYGAAGQVAVLKVPAGGAG